MKSYSKGFAGNLALYKRGNVQFLWIRNYPKEPEYLNENRTNENQNMGKVHEKHYKTGSSHEAC